MVLKRRKVKSKIVLLVILAFVALSSCDKKPHYDKTFAFKDKTWDQRNMPEFVVPITDTNQLYDFILTIRTTTDYKFSNLWIFLNTTTPTGIKAREPFQIRMANDDGTWIGSKTGTVVENKLLFKRRKFPDKGKFKFVIEHGITEEKVKEVMDIGLRVVAVD
jgi:gliding motility-associated lipoprotein GldH